LQLPIDVTTIAMIGLKRLIRRQAVNGVLQHVEIPNRLPDSFPD